MSNVHARKRTDNVIDMFTRKPISPEESKRIIRLSPELDGLEMLYSNDANPNKLFSMKILCWALRTNGEVVALVPWLNDIVACDELRDPLNGHWEGYYDQGIDEIFYQAPIHKVVELETAAEYYKTAFQSPDDIVHEIPDSIGTHAIITTDNFASFSLEEVISWQLLNNGMVFAMIIDKNKVKSTPVLKGDPCLFPAQQHDGFKYFFHHRIANKIKANDPDAIAAFSLLVDP
ncbi:hypothetical protein KCM76_00910 [Zooshikella marina]|uniref:Uncharacterized protein n=1 Tax=Zooshikella ganghwensis TaxID=202772 RepID=A0A4V1INC9_9GAMM|nr:hypothetical protein [Zooshikella ganghwensis]MBU2704521.1 hypothetical protein [Zooshikella ganghwensis]RDH43291.1 hypothetical protein B9G39_07470 [Zooshikella ganghwensis]